MSVCASVCACVRVGGCVHGSYQYVHVDWKSHRHDELRRLLGKVLQLVYILA